MKVNFSYDFTLTFPESVRDHRYCLRIVPYENAIQSCSRLDILVNANTAFEQGRDGFANRFVYGTIAKPHKSLSAHIEGELELSPYVYCDEEPPALYNAPSPLVGFCALMQAFLDETTLPVSTFRKAVVLTQKIRENFTLIESTKAEGLESFLLYKEGLRNDFSHLLIALLRHVNIPARLCHGFIEGENKTHTWVEAWMDGDWRGFDPIKGIVIHDEPYVKLAHGRDFSECAIYKGSYIGKRQHILKITGQIGREEQ